LTTHAIASSTVDVGVLLDASREPTATPALLDVDRLVQSRMLIQANSGGGKSHAIRLLLELTGHMLPFTLFDREGEFHTLRQMHDLLIVGGDVPITLASAGVTARATMESGVSVIVNLSELPTAQRGEYVRDWIHEMLLYGRVHPKPRLVVIDEAHDFAPEGGDAESFDAVRDLMATGRKRRLCGVLATQRLSKLSKDAAAEANNLLIGRCTLDTDQARAASTLGFSKKDGTRLRDLRSGMFFAFGPAFAHTSVEAILTHRVATTHGEDAMQLQAPAPSEGIAAAIAELAKAADAAAKVKAKDAEEDEEPSDETIANEEVATLQAELEATEHLVAFQRTAADQALTKLSGLVPILQGCIERITEAWNVLSDPRHQRAADSHTPRPLPASVPGGKSYAEPPVPAETGSIDSVRAGSSGPHKEAAEPVSSGGGVRSSPAAAAGDLPEGLGSPHQKILDALAWWHQAGVDRPTRPQLAAVAGYAATGGTFARYVSALSSAGLICYPGNGEISLTTAGSKLARAPRHATLGDLHNAALNVLEAPHRKILTVLLQAKGAEMSRTQVAELAGYEATGGTFNRYVSALSSARMVRYPKKTTIAAALWLFPKTLGGAR
jgi:hypothetical protein